MERLIIFGYGSIGSFIHQNLKNIDRVTIFSSKESNKLLNSNKFSFKSLNGKVHKIKCKSIASIPEKPFIVILCCKTYSISKFMSKFSTNKNMLRVIAIQNGIGHIKKLKKISSGKLILGNISNVSISRSRNTYIHHSGKGCLNLDKKFQKDKYILDFLDNLKLENKFYDIKNLIWRKLVRLNVISLVTSYKFRKLGDVLKKENARNELIQLLKETLDVAKADGYITEFDEELKIIESLPNDFRSSMSLDLKKKRRTEIMDITGEIIKIGKKNKVKCPKLEFYYKKLSTQIS